MSTVDIEDVQRLLDSDEEDPVLVLLRGRPVVIAAREQEAEEYLGALFISSRRSLEETGQAGSSPPELERLAAALSEMADRLGA